MTSLAGRTAIITGAGRGLGREHALRFAELGANVVVNDNGASSDGAGADDSPVRAVVEEIRAQGGQAVAHVGSVTDWDSAGEMVDLAVSTFGGLDILINNAGILRDRTIVNMSEEEWDSVIAVHLKGHFCALRHAAAYWRDQAKNGTPRKAAVVNTSSGSGLKGNPGQLNYASAKAGIAAMTIVAARELERYGVRVNAIAPVARTRLTLQTPGMGDLLAAEPGGWDKWAPGNVTPLVSYLVQEDCHISGQVFSVMGGHVGLEQGWTLVDQWNRDSAWTEEELAKALAKVPSAPPEFAVSL
ncbi:SDR family oxidoreductase [Nocardioides sp. LML1-1-1.1]|uniref:SDR family oxidoreductase n=1 Tax=Nocardioides sp. LML1-1-1.1 TaxID=3135248 RepID=UPI0034429ACA